MLCLTIFSLPLPRLYPCGWQKLFLCLFSPERSKIVFVNDPSPENIQTFTLEVSNKMGVHARPAAMIVRIASQFAGEVWVTKKEGDRVNAKSIMGIMMLAAARGAELTFECDKADAIELEKLMTDLFVSKFQDE